MRVNVMGMNNVFESARLMNIKRVVYASSIAVYGLPSSFEEKPITETDFCRPRLVYGAQKFWNEFMARKYMERYGLDIPGLRVPVVIGPRGDTGPSKWSSMYADYPAAGKPVEIPLRSNQRALIIYVDDIAKIFIRLCFTETLRYSIYNSCAYSVTLKELTQVVKKFLPKAEIRFNEKADDLPLVYDCSSERLEKEFQVKLSPFEEIVRKHINQVRKMSGLSEV